MLTAGNVSDIKAALALLERAGRMRYLLADKGYDADRLRRSLRDAEAVPVIPGRRNRKRIIRYDKDRYRGPTSSETPSVASKTSAGSPPATTSSPATSSQV
jgi:IS5 family transposase